MKKILTTVLIGFLVVLSACTSSDSSEPKNGDSSKGNFPITVKHALGETTIEEKPKRVVSIGWENQDVALALGITPVAMSMPAYGLQEDETMRIWTKEKYEELGVEEPIIFDDLNGLDFEAISDAKPDVILTAYSGISKEDYEILSEIAPVIAYIGEPFEITWQTQIEQNAKGLGLENEGKDFVKEIEDKIEKEVAKYPDMKGKSATFAWFDAKDTSSFFVYGNKDPRSKFLQDMGLELPDEIKKVTDESTGFFATVSAEKAEVLNNTDIIVIYGNADTLKVLQADPLLGKIPAIKNGSVVLLDDTSALATAAATPTALSIPYALKDYVKLIGEEAEKVK